MIEKKDILYSIYLAEGKKSVFDLLYEFGITYKELKPILDEYAEKGMVASEDGRFYTFIGSGRMFSGKFRRENISRYTSTLMEWMENNEDDDDDDDDDDDFRFKTRHVHGYNFVRDREAFLRKEKAYREYLESRKMDIMADVEDETEEDDEESSPKDAIHECVKDILREAQENLSDHDDDDDNDDDNGNNLSGSILESLQDRFDVEKEDEKYVISVSGLDFCGAGAKFDLFPHGERVYLCDRGATFYVLEERGELTDEGREKAERIAAESEAEIMEGKLCIRVFSSEKTLACLFRLYALMMRVLHIKDVLSREAEKQKVVPEEYIRALEYVVKSRKANIIDLHAEFRFGPNMIGLILEWMEKEGFISPFNSSEDGRKVLLTMEEFKRRFGK